MSCKKNNNSNEELLRNCLTNLSYKFDGTNLSLNNIKQINNIETNTQLIIGKNHVEKLEEGYYILNSLVYNIILDPTFLSFSKGVDINILGYIPNIYFLELSKQQNRNEWNGWIIHNQYYKDLLSNSISNNTKIYNQVPLISNEYSIDVVSFRRDGESLIYRDLLSITGSPLAKEALAYNEVKTIINFNIEDGKLKFTDKNNTDIPYIYCTKDSLKIPINIEELTSACQNVDINLTSEGNFSLLSAGNNSRKYNINFPTPLINNKPINYEIFDYIKGKKYKSSVSADDFDIKLKEGNINLTNINNEYIFGYYNYLSGNKIIPSYDLLVNDDLSCINLEKPLYKNFLIFFENLRSSNKNYMATKNLDLYPVGISNIIPTGSKSNFLPFLKIYPKLDNSNNGNMISRSPTILEIPAKPKYNDTNYTNYTNWTSQNLNWKNMLLEPLGRNNITITTVRGAQIQTNIMRSTNNINMIRSEYYGTGWRPEKIIIDESNGKWNSPDSETLFCDIAYLPSNYAPNYNGLATNNTFLWNSNPLSYKSKKTFSPNRKAFTIYAFPAINIAYYSTQKQWFKGALPGPTIISGNNDVLSIDSWINNNKYAKWTTSPALECTLYQVGGVVQTLANFAILPNCSMIDFVKKQYTDTIFSNKGQITNFDHDLDDYVEKVFNKFKQLESQPKYKKTTDFDNKVVYGIYPQTKSYKLNNKQNWFNYEWGFKYFNNYKSNYWNPIFNELVYFDSTNTNAKLSTPVTAYSRFLSIRPDPPLVSSIAKFDSNTQDNFKFLIFLSSDDINSIPIPTYQRYGSHSNMEAICRLYDKENKYYSGAGFYIQDNDENFPSFKNTIDMGYIQDISYSNFYNLPEIEKDIKINKDNTILGNINENRDIPNEILCSDKSLQIGACLSSFFLGCDQTVNDIRNADETKEFIPSIYNSNQTCTGGKWESLNAIQTYIVPTNNMANNHIYQLSDFINGSKLINPWIPDIKAKHTEYAQKDRLAPYYSSPGNSACMANLIKPFKGKEIKLAKSICISNINVDYKDTFYRPSGLPSDILSNPNSQNSGTNIRQYIKTILKQSSSNVLNYMTPDISFELQENIIKQGLYHNYNNFLKESSSIIIPNVSEKFIKEQLNPPPSNVSAICASSNVESLNFNKIKNKPSWVPPLLKKNGKLEIIALHKETYKTLLIEIDLKSLLLEPK